MSAAPVISLADVSLEESSLRPDFKLAEYYQAFSTELLRLSLLIIGGYGLLVKDVWNSIDQNSGRLELLLGQHSWTMWALVFVSLTAAFSLSHRYLSSDCLAHQIAYLRCRQVRGEATTSSSSENTRWRQFNDLMRQEKSRLRWKLKACGWLLGLAALCLAVGVGMITTAFLGMLREVV